MKLFSVVGFLVITPLTLLVILWLALARPILSNPGTFQPTVVIDPHELRQHVEQLSTQYLPRSHKFPQQLDRVAKYIQRHLLATGAQISTQTYQVDDKEYRNILAAYGPDTPNILVVGAHYDTYKALPGADDNASGIAGLLGLGQLLSERPLSTRIVLAAYTLEEPPFFYSNKMGSAVHAQSLREKGVAVDLMICLEMIGYFSEKSGSQDFPNPLLHLFYPSTGNFITIVDQLLSNQALPMKQQLTEVIEVPVYSINAPSTIEGVDFSDHLNFWEQGYPAVMVTDTAFYRNKAYHTSQDTADRLDYEKMAQVVYGVYHYLQFLDRRNL